jgi:hypothetical protein
MEFTDADLDLICAMCLTANPWYPAQPMLPMWKSIYDKVMAITASREG